MSVLDFADYGWHVFPLNGKAPATPNGFYDATSDRDGILKWVRTHNGNWGIRTGQATGVVVLDVDLKTDRNGVESLDKLQAQCGELPLTVSVQTGSGGFHYYFAHTGPLACSRDKIGIGLDVRADGGYVVAPGSFHPDTGLEYLWINSPREVPLAPLPGWLFGMALGAARPARAVARPTNAAPAPTPVLGRARRYLAKVDPAISGSGGQDQTFHAAVAMVRGFSLSEEQAYDLLASEYNPRCQPEWEEKDLRRKVNQAFEKSDKPDGYLLKDDSATEPPPSGAPSCTPPPTPGAPSSTPPPERPSIIIKHGQLHTAVADGIRAIAQRGDMYVRFDLVKVIPDGQGGERIWSVSSEVVREELARIARWFIPKKTNTVEDNPPKDVSQTIHKRGEWPGVPLLRALIQSPALSADGSIISRRGYNREHEIYLSRNAPDVCVPDKPTESDVLSARDTLLDLVVDFPFTTQRDEAAWLASLLTPLARPAIKGPTPLFAVTANMKGSGKSKLVDLVSIIAEGCDAPRGPLPKPEYMSSALTSIVKDGRNLHLFDNVTQIGGNDLDALLTGTGWTDRLLTTNDIPKYQVNVVLYATGNAIEIQGDTSRRTVRVGLESQVEQPQLRSGWRHDDLLGYAMENRPRLLSAALTILRAHAVKGWPMNGPTWGSYEAWSKVARGAVVGCGMVDPFDPSETLEMDEESAALGVFLHELKSASPVSVTTAQILALADKNVDLMGALVMFCPGRGSDGPDAKVLGRSLAKVENRPCSGLKLIMSGKERNGAKRWDVAVLK